MNKNWDTPFVSGSGLCYPSKDYSNVNNLKGGKVNPEGIIKTSFGGSKSKKQRGGQPLDQSYGSYPPEESLTGSLGEVQDFQEGSRLAPVSDTKQCGGKKQKQKIPSPLFSWASMTTLFGSPRTPLARCAHPSCMLAFSCLDSAKPPLWRKPRPSLCPLRAAPTSSRCSP